jgi:hypothetical protein
MLKIAKMTPADRPRMLEIVKDIWDGNDYMPLVFENWIKDKKGEFAGAFDENGVLIGFEKLTMLTDRDAWIEGLRKDLKMKVKGVGRFLTIHLLNKLSADKGIKTIRFATYFHNIESITLFKKMGFRVLERRNHKYYKLPKLKNIPQYKGNRAEKLTCEKEIIRFVKNSEWVVKDKNGICHSWVVKPYSDEMIIRDYIRKGTCIGIRENGKITALCLYTIREPEDLFISFFWAQNEKLFKELIQKVKQTAYLSKNESLCVVINQKDSISYSRFKNSGFKSWEAEKDFLLFDFPVKRLKDFK